MLSNFTLAEVVQGTPATPFYYELIAEDGTLADSTTINLLLQSRKLPEGLRNTPGYLEWANPVGRTKPALYSWSRIGDNVVIQP